MPKVLAVIVSYHPENDLIENVQALLKQVNHLVIVDNGTNSDSQKLFSLFPAASVSTILNSENKGVAEGFNQGLRWGLERGFDFFLLMDQDSRPSEAMTSNLLKAERFKSQLGELVLVGPHHEAFDRPIPKNEQLELEPVPLLITSGSLVPRTLIEKVGLYDERLFIDHVDHDYCLRVERAGGRCYKVNSAVLLHKFGKSEIRSFLGKKFFIQDYSEFRRYYMMRNRIVLYKRYGIAKGKWFWLDLRSALKDLVKVIFFETHKITKLSATLRGLRDGLKWKDS